MSPFVKPCGKIRGKVCQPNPKKRRETNGQEQFITHDMELQISYSVTDSNLNHTGIYLYSKGKIMIHLTLNYKTDEN